MNRIGPTLVGALVAVAFLWFGLRAAHQLGEAGERKLARWGTWGAVVCLLTLAPGVQFVITSVWGGILILLATAGGAVAVGTGLALRARRRFPGLVAGVDAWAGVPQGEQPGEWTRSGS